MKSPPSLRGRLSAALPLAVVALASCNLPDESLDCGAQVYELCDVRESACQDAIYAEVRCLRAGAGDVQRPEVVTLNEQELRELFGADMSSAPASTDDKEPSADELRFERVERGLSLVGLVDLQPPAGEPQDPGDPEPPPDETEVFLQGLLGFYSGQTKSIVVVERPGIDFDTPLAVSTLAHEFVHAIQDQTYGLAKTRADKGPGHDASLAMTSLIEGEAMLFEGMHRARIEGLTLSQWSEAFRESTHYADDRAVANPSPIWTSAFAFPYTYGAFGVATQWDADGRRGVEALWRGPATTSQRYMAERYDVSVVDEQVWLDAPPPADAGYEIVADDVMGAWLVHTFLSRTLGGAAAEPALALDWRGDRITLLRDTEADEMVTVWRLLWASSAAAREFVAAVEAGTPPRGGWQISRDGKTTVIVASETSAELRSLAAAAQDPKPASDVAARRALLASRGQGKLNLGIAEPGFHGCVHY